MYNVRLCCVCCRPVLLYFGTSPTWQVYSFVSWATIKVVIMDNSCNPLTIMPVYNFRRINISLFLNPFNMKNSTKVLFCPVIPDIRKIITVKVPRSIVLITILLRWTCVWSIGGMILTGKLKYLEKSQSVSICPPHVSHGLVWYRTWASAASGWRHKAWASLKDEKEKFLNTAHPYLWRSITF